MPSGSRCPDAIPLSASDAVCPVVPLFHACGWGIAYTAPMNGAKLVLPGPRLDGQSLYELFEAEGVTMSLGVPTVWLGFEALPRGQWRALLDVALDSVGRLGGAAFADRGVRETGHSVRQGWGMTEMSPVGTTAALKAKHLGLDPDAQMKVKCKAGPAGVRRRDEGGRRCRAATAP